MTGQTIPRSRGCAGLALHVDGTVQGVGFRPFVYRLAQDEELKGWVRNSAQGVDLEVFGSSEALERFVRRLCAEAPPLARIERIERRDIAGEAPTGFAILESASGAAATPVTPDAAVCQACLDELHDPAARRYRYPFLNCTHCGPRFSIVEAVPYDRARTSMKAFALCGACRTEYEDPADRRFHAQPIACPSCGPTLWLEDGTGRRLADGEAAVSGAIDCLRGGGIVALKGLGGFHLACLATDAAAVGRLRRRKARPTKPFAVMIRDRETASQFVCLDDAAWRWATDPSAPIVLVERRSDGALPEALAPGLDRLGVMVPYTPLHALLMAAFEVPLVMTSGNPGNDPQETDNDPARERLAPFADLLLMHDRPIVNRVDDSLVQVTSSGPQVLRRGRGFTPSPLGLSASSGADHPETLALGGDIKNAFAIAKAGRVVLSQHIGDLTSAVTRDDLERQIALYVGLYDIRPRLVAVDAHPGYASSGVGWALAQAWGAQLVEVAHHHAHAAACMVEHGIGPDEEVLALVQDGLGYGQGGGLLGAELLCCDYRTSRRLATLRPAPLPGGDRASVEPWRNLLAGLHALDPSGAAWPDGLKAVLQDRPIGAVVSAIDAGVNAPSASSAGRLFDAVAAAIGLCPDGQGYEGEAAMRLQAMAERWIARHGEPDGYPFDVREGAVREVDPGTLWAALGEDIGRRTAGCAAARFHVGWAAIWARMVAEEAGRTGAPRTVVLSGGTFGNRLLSRLVSRKLTGSGLRVLQHGMVPPNDGGLALGQIAIALARQTGGDARGT